MVGKGRSCAKMAVKIMWIEKDGKEILSRIFKKRDDESNWRTQALKFVKICGESKLLVVHKTGHFPWKG